MQRIFLSLFILTLFGCASYSIEQEVQNTGTIQSCLGNPNLPNELATQFEPIEDTLLLNEALGSPTKGKLCQGKVYKSKANSKVTLFRAWNSTNPNSQFGKWWAFRKPTGKIATYRSEYEICYQWSPLDKLVSCTLMPETKVVVGTGQSAKCSEYLTYPTSDKQQVYLDDASTSLYDCITFNGEFSWK